MITGFHLYGRALRNLINRVSTKHGLYTEPRHDERRRSLFVRHFDGGSSDGCDLEIANLFGPVYDAERFGLRLVASPRHADVLLITGPITRRLQPVLRLTFEAMPEPRWIVLIGDDALGQGLFCGSPEVAGLPTELEPYVATRVPGNPPTPQAMLEALLRL